jgi:arsenate reductase (glutaredoxin)
MTLTLYGIPNCDTVKRARAWLAEHGQALQFHDFKRSGVPEAELERWMEQLGWERLLNRQGTTWRKLDQALRNTLTDATQAKRLMLANPSCIKRPVVAWPHGEVSVGFDVADWAARV